MMHERKREDCRASSAVDLRILARLLAGGYDLVCKTRSAEKLTFAGRAAIHTFDSRDARPGVSEFIGGARAVYFAFGTETLGVTTLRSETASALIEVIKPHSLRRLIAITGVGPKNAGGHSSFLYHWITFPLFIRSQYRRSSSLHLGSMGIEHPCAIHRQAHPGNLQALVEISPDLVDAHPTGRSHADIALAQLNSEQFLANAPLRRSSMR